MKPAEYAKAIAAVATAALTAAQTAIPMSAAAHGWVVVILALLGALAVYQVPNAKPAPTPPDYYVRPDLPDDHSRPDAL